MDREEREAEQLSHLVAGMESVINTVDTVFLATGDSADSRQSLDQLRKCLKDLITEENKAIKSSNVMTKIQGQLNDSLLEGRGLENLEEMFENALKEERNPKLQIEKHEMMAKFESK